MGVVCRHAEQDVVLEYGKWALSRDEAMAVNIFTNRDANNLLPPGQVLDYLVDFTIATIAYLEFLVLQQGSKVKKNKNK